MKRHQIQELYKNAKSLPAGSGKKRKKVKTSQPKMKRCCGR